VKQCGEPGASSQGVLELLTIMSQGRGAIWVDATVIGGLLQDPKTSKVVDKIGYAFAPTEGSSNGGWLTAWSLGVVASSKHQEDAFKFIRWATSKQYAKLVAEKYGVVRMPPGTRYSTYKDPAYLKASPFAQLTMQTIENADILHPAKDPVPYTGTAQINIPEFATWAADFAQNYSAVIAGTMTIDDALQSTQTKTEQVMRDAGYIKD
jgi:sorbitol/mannitol transport system substrate-binding protein